MVGIYETGFGGKRPNNMIGGNPANQNNDWWKSSATIRGKETICIYFRERISKIRNLV
jgi:hypothetical protein